MDYSEYFRAILALAFVLGLVGLASFLAKKFLLERQLNIGNKVKRLSVEEVRPIDTKRRLVLIKRDDVEHLVLIGQNSELLIEANISSSKNETPKKNKK
ncbi:MAG: flagellar assembly protein FliO [Rickettsiaceae bacterium]|jgi:flagellar protein FliO/FliZ|nr:flagellar assembly protein FliO [Rickettsiaceae bacterium]